MAKIVRIKVPSFDLAWCETRKSTEVNLENYLLLPGGGGSTKSGVKNQIIIAQYKNLDNKQEISFCDSHLTDTEKRNSLCSGISFGKNVLEVINLLSTYLRRFSKPFYYDLGL